MPRAFLPVHRGVPQADLAPAGPAMEPRPAPAVRPAAPEPAGQGALPLAGSPFVLASVFPPSGAGVPPVQAKLTIGAPRDRHELEADRMAENVVDFLHAPPVDTPREAPGEGEVPGVSAARNGRAVLLQGCDCCGGTCGTTELETDLQAARKEGGEPLPSSVRQPMERAFGTDFRDVTVHHDRPADQLNHRIQARAFTTGRDIFFRQGEYVPQSRGGQELLAHELTHVVQQGGGELRRSPAESLAAGSAPLPEEVLQRACTRSGCGPDPDPSGVDLDQPEDLPEEAAAEVVPIEVEDEAEHIDLELKPLPGRSSALLLQRAPAPAAVRGGHPFAGAAAVPAGAGHLLVQRATATGELDSGAATPNNLGGAAGAFHEAHGATTTTNAASSMTATWLHEQGAGSRVKVRPDDWDKFKALANGKNPFCQGHFLSQKLGGQGDNPNLAPFTRSLNGTHYHQVEEPVIAWTGKGGQRKWAHYKVEADYGGNAGITHWAQGELNSIPAHKQPAVVAAFPGANHSKRLAAAEDWIDDYVTDTFPKSIDCTVQFIQYKGASYKATNEQKVNITNDF